jgi:16S rRNA (adenine1518-N6/adenine1519-N6)-dimethyltransferase
MDLALQKDIKNLLNKHGCFPSKGLGQVFLIDRAVLSKIIETANLSPKDVVLEIGPGIGNLTQEIAKKVKTVITVEKDLKMCEILKETLKDLNNIKVIHGDILKILNSKFIIHNSYKVVANLPYYIVSPVIRKFLETDNPPKEMVLMVQKEVAQRICSQPPNMSILSISVQFYATPEIISFVSKKSFWPQPKVDSAVIRISRIRTNLPRIDTNLFFKIVKAGFSQPRKQILNNLSKELEIDKEKIKLWLLKNNVNPIQRAETLSLDDWISLTNQVVENRQPRPL